MLRFVSILPLLALLALAGCGHRPCDSTLTVRTTGDARVYGVYTSTRPGAGWR